VPQPPLAWPALVTIGSTLFTGQFLFQFLGIAQGMPPGLAAIVVQTQALFTILFAAALLRERPTPRQLIGTTVAFAGLVVIGASLGQGLGLGPFALTLISAISWGIGNVLVKRLGRVEMVDLMVWLSLVPPVPAFAVSVALDGPAALAALPARVSWLGLGAALYLGLVATVLAYAIWGELLRRYPAATLAPFALLVPFVAAGASAVVFGERFGIFRLVGMALVLVGLAVIVLPVLTSRPHAVGSGAKRP
jgi:O-acetylserine/cysteine efflux transporter